MARILGSLVVLLLLLCLGTTTASFGAAAKAASGSQPASLRDGVKMVHQDVRAGRFERADSLSQALLTRVDAMRTGDSTLVADVWDARVSFLLNTQQVTDSAGGAMAVGVVALRERIQGVENSDVANSLASLAWFRFFAGDYDAALEPARRALAIGEHASPPDTMGMSNSLNLLASIEARRGNPSGAQEQYRRALALNERKLGPNHQFVAAVLNNIAASLMTQGDYAAARSLVERSLAIRIKRLGPNHPEVGVSLNAMGNIMLHIGDYPAAHDYFLRALAVADSSYGPESPDAAFPINGLGIVAEETGEYATARTYYDRALAIREKALGPDHPETGWTVMNIGNLLQAEGNYTDAMPLYDRALRIAEKSSPESPDVAQVLDNMANNLDLRGEHATAKPLYERALAIREKVLEPDNPEIARNLNNLGTLLFAQGDRSGAARLYARALGIQERSLGKEHHEIGATLELLGEVRVALGDNVAAESLLTRSIAIRSKVLGPEHPQLAQAAWGLAGAEARLDKDSLALAQALVAERISRDHLRLTARSLSEDAALRYAAVRTSGLDVALSLLSQGRAGAFRGTVLDEVIRSRALVLDEMAFRRHASRSSADTETVALTTTYRNARARLAHLLLNGPEDENPGGYSALVSEARRASDDAERGLTAKSATFRAEHARDQAGLAAIDSVLAEDAALVSFVRFSPIPLQAGRLPKGPNQRAQSYIALIKRRGAEPAVVPIGSATKVDSLVGAWRREAGRGLFAAGRSPRVAENAYRKAGIALRKAVWDPVAKQCGGATTLFVVPDGSLSLVNWSALPGAHDGYLVEEDALIHLLTAERDLVEPRSRPGVGLLAVGGPDFDSNPDSIETTLAAAGGQDSGAPATYRGQRADCVAFRSVRFRSLPGSAREAEEVSMLWSGGRSASRVPSGSPPGARSNVVRLTGREASERAVRDLARGSDVLHLATHGFFLTGDCVSAIQERRGIGLLEPADETNPPAVAGENPLRLAGLALAGANRRNSARSGGDDGILTAEEISSLDLTGVSWAVLSACDTGTGELHTGEGVLGLRRSFQIAGARTVISSLWSVDDAATQEWMRALYSARFERGLSTAESIRAAARQVLQARRAASRSTHPFYWGAFVASGGWE